MQGKVHMLFIRNELSHMRKAEREKAKIYDGVNIPEYEKAIKKLNLYNEASTFCGYLPEYVDYSILNGFKIAYIVSNNDEMLAIIKIIIDIYQAL
jgi:hypothetical protein